MTAPQIPPVPPEPWHVMPIAKWKRIKPQT